MAQSTYSGKHCRRETNSQDLTKPPLMELCLFICGGIFGRSGIGEHVRFNSRGVATEVAHLIKDDIHQ